MRAFSGRFTRSGYPPRTARRLRSVERTVPFRTALCKTVHNGGTIADMAFATPMPGRMTRRLSGTSLSTLPFYASFAPALEGPEGRVASLLARPTGRTLSSNRRVGGKVPHARTRCQTRPRGTLSPLPGPASPRGGNGGAAAVPGSRPARSRGWCAAPRC